MKFENGDYLIWGSTQNSDEGLIQMGNSLQGADGHPWFNFISTHSAADLKRIFDCFGLANLNELQYPERQKANAFSLLLDGMVAAKANDEENADDIYFLTITKTNNELQITFPLVAGFIFEHQLVESLSKNDAAFECKNGIYTLKGENCVDTLLKSTIDAYCQRFGLKQDSDIEQE